MHDERSALRQDYEAIVAGSETLGLALPRDDEPPSFATLWRAILSQRDDPWLPLWIGEAVPFGHYESIDYLCASCSTPGHALVALQRHYGLLSAKLELELDGDQLRLRPRPGPPMQRRVIALYVTGLILARLRAACVGSLGLARVTLLGPPEAELGPLERRLGAPCSIGAEQVELEFEPEALNAPMRRARPELMQALEHYIAELAERRGIASDPLAEIRGALRTELETGEVTLESVARRLGNSERTLQRRLASAGLSFRALLDEQRLDWAVSLLERPELGMCEIAFRMGYSEQSAFTRAFKRWTGSSPSRYRDTAAARCAGAQTGPKAPRAERASARRADAGGWGP